MSFGAGRGLRDMGDPAKPVVHLELLTGDGPGARDFYADLCGWRAEEVDTGGGSYVALDLGAGVGGGIVQCSTARAVWLPYVEVPEIRSATVRAHSLGANVLLRPREGPLGWRSVVSAPAGGAIAFWQPKR
jgi:predicted enzyme related to lactoylglutathione lyase